jgi:DNA-binding GntR family transcriptional regulator
MIIRLELAPGSVLNESALMDELGLGRTPIREALQRLRRDELVTILPRRGVFVTQFDLDDLPLLFNSRAVIEPHLAELAAYRGTKDHWDEIETVLAGTEDPAVSADTEAMVEADNRCHAIVWDAAGNRFLTATAEMLYAQSNRLWHLYLGEIEDMGPALDEHRRILCALRAGNGALAAQLTEEHVRTFEQEIREGMQRRMASGMTTARL